MSVGLDGEMWSLNFVYFLSPLTIRLESRSPYKPTMFQRRRIAVHCSEYSVHTRGMPQFKNLLGHVGGRTAVHHRRSTGHKMAVPLSFWRTYKRSDMGTESVGKLQLSLTHVCLG